MTKLPNAPLRGRASFWFLAPPLLLALSPVRLGAQPATTQATALLAQSLAALAGGTALTDVQLQANINYVAGSVSAPRRRWPAWMR
jgi:hypothetical protein